MKSSRDRSIRWRVGGHLLLILLLILVNLGSVGWLLNEQKQDGTAINAAGKQRLLVEKMTTEALLIEGGESGSRDELATDAAQYDRSLTALLEGNTSMGIPPAPPAVRRQLLSVREEWKPFYAHIRTILTEPRSSSEFRQSLEYVREHSGQLLRASDEAVERYETAFERKVTGLQLFLVGVFGLDLLVVPLLFAFTDRHILRPIERMAAEARTVASDDMNSSIDIVDANDEVGELSRSLHEMKEQLVSAVRDAKRFEEAVEHAGHAIYITDTDGTIEYVNPSFEEITKYSADEAIGENPRILNSGKQSESHYEELWETILSGDIWREETVNKRASGELFHGYQTIAPITDVDGDLAGFVAILSDNTEQIVSNQQNQVLRRVLRHNLRNELNLIEGYARELGDTSDAEKRAEYVERIRERIDDLVNMSASVGQFARTIEQGPHREQELCTVIERISRRMKDRYSPVEITTDTPPHEVTVRGHVALICKEIIENAIEHNDQATPEITVTVTVHEEPDPSPTVQIEIEDDGPGIPPEERTVIEEGEETPLLHGSGLGLWISHWMATIAGGEIAIEERDPHGTRITLLFPRASLARHQRTETGD